ncbi:universal stress protein [Nocardia sp. CDC159]|uniref:Universal stress protein n=1 Tax=Nocardia pulmonis TaxID=2951408 RepID=A0A9X2E207_9NOCA|nr:MULTISPECIES: universal stress protein [Nocardia]MCM6772414.1 universal stress protein [Nocardia pulmonis]MCM6784928.1 universal stress protein [Nocardia sp. CDC159]
MTSRHAFVSNPINPPILVGVDGSAVSLRAAAWAATEAALHHCPLHILTSFGVAPGDGLQAVVAEGEKQWLRADGERMLAEAASIARHTVSDIEVPITTELTFYLATPTLIDRSARLRMIVVGNNGRGAIRRAILGSVSTALSRHAHCPVAVIHDDRPADPGWAERPVLVGVDGTANSALAVEIAFDEASRRKVGLIALHTWSDISGYDLPVSGWEGIREHEDTVLAEGLAGWSERYPDVAVERIVMCDSPVRSLLDHSRLAQMVVVGSRGRGGFASMVLGSTSTALLHLAECPVIVAREKA